MAFSNSFLTHLFVRVNLSSVIERSSKGHRAGLISEIARPSDAGQARTAISSVPARPARAVSAGSSLEFPRSSQVFWAFRIFSSFPEFSATPSGLERLRRIRVCSSFPEFVCFIFARAFSVFSSCFGIPLTGCNNQLDSKFM